MRQQCAVKNLTGLAGFPTIWLEFFQISNQNLHRLLTSHYLNTPKFGMRYPPRIFIPSRSISRTRQNFCEVSLLPHLSDTRTYNTTSRDPLYLLSHRPQSSFPNSISKHSKRLLGSEFSSSGSRFHPPKAGALTQAMPGRKSKGTSREVEISRSLSYLLRHGAKTEGIELDEAGWANVADVLVWRRIASLKVNLTELQSIVATNDKKRYQIELDPAGTLRAPNTRITSTTASDSADWRIRATQGHSITTISSDQIFKPILLTDADCPDFVVHGTDFMPWKEIERSGGLKPMRRKHIHFATKLPDKLPPLDREHQSQSRPKEGPIDKVLSGMRLTSTIVIWVDVKKSLEGGVTWWRSENEVVLTEGIGEPKMLGFEWFKWVEKRGSGEILYGEKVESGEVGELERRMDSLRVGLGEGEKVDGGKAPQEDVNGEKVLQEKKANGDKKLGPAAAVKDNWDD